MNSEPNSIPDAMPKAGANRFVSTQWNVVAEAANGNRDSLEHLCRDYWKPLYWHVRRMGYAEDDARDLTQSFFLKLVDRGVVGLADPDRGRFRTFLLTSLRRFVINEWRRERTVRRGGRLTTVRFDFDSVDQCWRDEPRHNVTPDALFEKQWAYQLIENALTTLQQKYEGQGKADKFDRMLPFVTPQSPALDYHDLAVACNSTVAAVKMAVSRFRGEFGQHIRDQLRATVPNDADVDDELRLLLQALSA